MSRWKASLIHLTISAVVATAVLALMLLLWYPDPLFAAGVWQRQYDASRRVLRVTRSRSGAAHASPPLHAQRLQPEIKPQHHHLRPHTPRKARVRIPEQQHECEYR